MITALDSSVLWALLRKEPGAEWWSEALRGAVAEGPLILGPVVFAELAGSANNSTALLRHLERLQIQFTPISPAAAYLAGETFRRYRLAGGPREHLVPDFLIAAQAQVQADRLAAIDRGYLGRWFPELKLLVP